MSRPALFALYDAGFAVSSDKAGDILLRFPTFAAWESFLTHRAPAKSEFGEAKIPAAGWRLLLDAIDEAILDVRDPYVGDLFSAVRRRHARLDAGMQARVLARLRYLIRELEHVA